MKLFLTILFVGLFSLPLFAQRIIVTKTAYKSNLDPIHSKLHSIGVKMYVNKKDGFYFIYTKEYETREMAESKLQEIHRFFPAAKIVLEAKEEQREDVRVQEKRNWIVGLGLGINSISGKSGGRTVHSNGDMSYTFKAGYFIREDFLATLSYSSVSSNDTTITNSYFAANYYNALTQSSDIYAGVLLGYSELSIDLPKATPSTSILYGLQAGISYNMLGYIPLSLTWRSIFLDHSIAIKSGTTTIHRDTTSQNIIELGVAYKF